MSVELSDEAREVLRLVKELQVDGRLSGDSTNGTTVRFDPVPEYMIAAERFHGAGHGPGMEDSGRVAGALTELRTRDFVERQPCSRVQFVEYARPDGLIVEVLPEMAGSGGMCYRVTLWDGPEKSNPLVCIQQRADGRSNIPAYSLTPEGFAALDELRKETKRNRSDKGRASKRGGRKPVYDPEEDARIAQAWHTGEHKTHTDLAKAKGVATHQVKQALDRHRKRRKNPSV